MAGAKRANARIDFEHGGRFVENLWWKVSLLHDFVASASAICDGGEDFGFYIVISKEMKLGSFAVACEHLLGEELV